jgi:hypothetical protein
MVLGKAWSRFQPILAPAAILAATLGSLPVMAQRPASVPPGREPLALELLTGPGGVPFSCEDWSLTTIRVGPDCAVRAEALQGESGDTARIELLPGPSGSARKTGAFDMNLSAGPGHARDIEILRKCLLDRLHDVDSQAFFSRLCAGLGAAEGDRPRDASAPWKGVAWLGLMLAGIAIAVLLSHRIRSTAPPPDRPFLDRTGWIVAAVLSVAAVLARLGRMMVLSPEHLELNNALELPVIMGILDFPAHLGSLPQILRFHPPLVPWGIQAWLHAMDALGLGFDMFALRIVNLALAPIGIVLLLRIGRVLDLPLAGLGAAVILTLMPAAILGDVHVGPYPVERIAILWFLERLATALVRQRSVPVTLGLSAALVGWISFTGLLVVVPGTVLFMWRALAARPREALVILVLLATLLAPLGEAVGIRTWSYIRISAGSETIGRDGEAPDKIHHQSLPDNVMTASDFLASPYREDREAFPIGDGWASRPLMWPGLVAMLGIALLAVFRWRLVVLPAAVIGIFFLAGRFLYLRQENLSALWPFLVLAPLAGFASVPWGRRWFRAGRILVWAFVAFCLSVAAVVHLGPIVLPEQPGPRGWPGWMNPRYDPLLATSSFDAMTRELAEPGNQDLPLVVVDDSAQRYLCILLCSRGRDLWTYLGMDCPDRTAALFRDPGFGQIDACGRSAFVFHAGERARTAISRLELLESEWPAPEGSYFVLFLAGDWYYLLNSSRSLPDRLAACRPEQAPPDLVLLRCPGDPTNPQAPEPVIP